MNKKIESLIIKFLTKEADIDELRQLEIWIGNPKNETLFKEYIKTNAFINIATGKYDRKSAQASIVRRIKQENNIFRYRSRIHAIIKYAVAVIVLGILTTTYFFRESLLGTQLNTTPIIVNSGVKPGTDKATLTLDDGSQITLEKGDSLHTQNASSNGEEIVYKANQSNGNTKEVAYNYLTIPRGGQFFIKLSDGTKVWLNSESQLKYPINFKKTETRQVELVYGEAYFDVSPSTRHKDSKFKVLNQSQEIEVLGTEFNIKAYKDETNIYTTLVEGKVSVKTSTTDQLLKPTQQANLDLHDSTISIASVDIYNEISWKEGVFSFEEKPLKEIMKVLSRWYDIDVVFKNVALEDEEFMGVLGKDQNIEEILSNIKNFGIIKNYRISDKELILE